MSRIPGEEIGLQPEVEPVLPESADEGRWRCSAIQKSLPKPSPKTSTQRKTNSRWRVGHARHWSQAQRKSR